MAFLTAVSYHHIWFSQNARGYSAYLLFCVLATGALWRLIATPERRWIALYAVCAVLGLTSLIITAFVIITHVLLAAALVILRQRRAEPVAPLVRRLALAFGATAVASLVVYGPTAIELRLRGRRCALFHPRRGLCRLRHPQFHPSRKQAARGLSCCARSRSVWAAASSPPSCSTLERR